MQTVTEFYSARPLTPEQETTFFEKLRLANGVFKRTADHRLDDLNEIILSRWHETAFQPREIMDVGVSSGISTAEWLEGLSRAGLKVRMTATDLALWGHIVPLCPGVYVIETTDGHLLRPIVLGVPILPSWRGYRYFRALVTRIAALRCSRRNLKKLLLVSPRALRHDAIEWAEDDVLAPNPAQFVRRFDAIRAANILAPCYFSADQLQRAVANLKDRLAGPNAQLIINRTLADGSNHATMFRLTDANRFEAEVRVRQGSEIEDIVLRA